MMMTDRLLNHMLQTILHKGQLTIHYPSGVTERYGDGSGKPVALRLKENRAVMKFVTNPALALGETYMDGQLEMEQGEIYDLISLFLTNLYDTNQRSLLQRIMFHINILLKHIDQYNPIQSASDNVAHHYDLDDGLYDLFLDEDKQYSCAYFEHPEMTLEQAQEAKKQHLIRKLQLQPGQRVLDIGCGWGGMALSIAKSEDVSVLGVTLSEKQFAIATQRAKEQGLADRVEFRLVDYRKLRGTFDRIISVGMFEHVGARHYPEFFTRLYDLLADDGNAVLHSIGRAGPPGATNPWIKKYIFPGGYIPALSEVMPVMEKAKLWPGDIEILRLHYAETLLAWRERFMEKWADAATLYDERFCRMWEFYLACSEAAFRDYDHFVFQLQLLKNVEASPLTRTYMYPEKSDI